MDVLHMEVISLVYLGNIKLFTKRHTATGSCDENANMTGCYSEVRGSNLRLEISCSGFLLPTRKCRISTLNTPRPHLVRYHSIMWKLCVWLE